MRFPAFLSSRAGAVLRSGLTFGLLAWLAAQVDWAGVRRLDTMDRPLAVMAVMLAGLAYPLQAWRWHLLLRAQGLALPVLRVHAMFWLGQFCNSFLPGGVAGDAVRFGWLWREHPGRKAAAAASLAADRLLGLGALSALAALALGLHLAMSGGGAELQALLGASLAAFALLLGGGWMTVRTRWWEPVTARMLGADRAAALHDAATALGRQQAPLAAATGLSVAVWLADFVSLWLLARAVGLTAGPLEMSVAAAAAHVAAALPVSVGGHGVREGTLVGVLALLGIGAGQEGEVAVLALAFLIVSVVWSLAGGPVYLLARRADRAGSGKARISSP